MCRGCSKYVRREKNVANDLPPYTPSHHLGTATMSFKVHCVQRDYAFSHTITILVCAFARLLKSPSHVFCVPILSILVV